MAPSYSFLRVRGFDPGKYAFLVLAGVDFEKPFVRGKIGIGRKPAQAAEKALSCLHPVVAIVVSDYLALARWSMAKDTQFFMPHSTLRRMFRKSDCNDSATAPASTSTPKSTSFFAIVANSAAAAITESFNLAFLSFVVSVAAYSTTVAVSMTLPGKIFEGSLGKAAQGSSEGGREH